MRPLAPDVALLELAPTFAFNVYLLGDVLIDSGPRRSSRRVLRELAGSTVRAHALTHPHPDHQGASRDVCTTLGVPLWAGAADADAMESGDLRPLSPDSDLARRYLAKMAGPGHAVSRRLVEGDDVAGFTVLAAGGHSPGHIAFWRPNDRVLILGDVLTNLDAVTRDYQLGEPPESLSVDVAANRCAARRLTALAPELVLFGHGPPLRNREALERFVDGLGTQPAAVQAARESTA